MRLINNQQPIFWEKVKQSRWWLASFAPIKMPGIILNSLYKSSLFQHFEIIFCALTEPLRL